MKGKDFDTKICPISFIDLEMTGLESTKHEIVEIGLVKVSQPDLIVIEKWEAKVRPMHPETGDPVAVEISGYDQEKWKDSIMLQEMMQIFAVKVKGTILAGFNVSSDYSFLDVAITQTGIPLDVHRRILDVNPFAVGKKGWVFGENGLGSMTKLLGIKLENHHTALADAVATYEVYRKVVQG